MIAVWNISLLIKFRSVEIILWGVFIIYYQFWGEWCCCCGGQFRRKFNKMLAATTHALRGSRPVQSANRLACQERRRTRSRIFGYTTRFQNRALPMLAKWCMISASSSYNQQQVQNTTRNIFTRATWIHYILGMESSEVTHCNIGIHLARTYLWALILWGCLPLYTSSLKLSDDSSPKKLATPSGSSSSWTSTPPRRNYNQEANNELLLIGCKKNGGIVTVL